MHAVLDIFYVYNFVEYGAKKSYRGLLSLISAMRVFSKNMWPEFFHPSNPRQQEKCKARNVSLYSYLIYSMYQEQTSIQREALASCLRHTNGGIAQTPLAPRIVLC